jgi:uncharacterized membrane protein
MSPTWTFNGFTPLLEKFLVESISLFAVVVVAVLVTITLGIGIFVFAEGITFNALLT